MDFHYDIDFIFPNDEPPFDSSSDDDETELTLAIAIEELNKEHQHHVVVLFNLTGLSSIILCKVMTGFSMIILLKHQCIGNLNMYTSPA